MRPDWNRNHDWNAGAANDPLRPRYADRRETMDTDPIGIPYQLNQAIRDPRWSGEPVLVTANGRDVAAVLGTESTDALAIWRDITAAAVQADVDPGTGLRLMPPAPLAEGLRAVAVPSEQQVVVWQSSAESVSNRQRRIAARRALRALRALHGRQIPRGVLLSLLVPGWRKAAPIAALAAAAVVAVMLIPAGPGGHPNRSPSAPAVAATPHVTVGAGHTPSSPSSSPVASRRTGRNSRRGRLAAGDAAPSQHSGTQTASSAPAPSQARTSATQPQSSPTSTSSPHHPAKKKGCALKVLGVCVK